MRGGSDRQGRCLLLLCPSLAVSPATVPRPPFSFVFYVDVPLELAASRLPPRVSHPTPREYVIRSGADATHLFGLVLAHKFVLLGAFVHIFAFPIGALARLDIRLSISHQKKIETRTCLETKLLGTTSLRMSSSMGSTGVKVCVFV